MTRGFFWKKQGRARISPRRSSLALCLAGIGMVLIGLMFVHARLQQQDDLSSLEAVSRVVANLELTDLALFTEARYTRHLSQADLHSAFQDHPTSLEHFPTGSIAGPPAGLRRHHGKLD